MVKSTHYFFYILGSTVAPGPSHGFVPQGFNAGGLPLFPTMTQGSGGRPRLAARQPPSVRPRVMPTGDVSRPPTFDVGSTDQLFGDAPDAQPFGTWTDSQLSPPNPPPHELLSYLSQALQMQGQSMQPTHATVRAPAPRRRK